MRISNHVKGRHVLFLRKAARLKVGGTLKGTGRVCQIGIDKLGITEIPTIYKRI
jgi:hypothetical protein